jgi:molybdopterin-guanine dinucleotide biosynthesis protein A
VTRALAGIFVGGVGNRMGRLAKGLMRTAEGTTLIARWQVMLERLGVGVVLVGGHLDYARFGLEVIGDEPPGIGPLGGLVALLRRANNAPTLALACDMPFVSGGLAERLLTSFPEAPILAPRREGRWEPLCARYDPARVLAGAIGQSRGGDHSLQRLLHDAGAVELALAADELGELDDWDTPEDVAAGKGQA